MQADSLQRRPWALKIWIPFFRSSSVDDLALLTVLTPVWWYLGVEQFIWFLALPLLTLKVLWNRRGRIAYPTVALLFSLFLAGYLLSGFAIENFSQVDSFLRKFGVFFSTFLLFIIILNGVHSWGEIKKLILALLVMMAVAAGMGMMGIIGLFRPQFQAPIASILPGWIINTAVGGYISQRIIGHFGLFLSFRYYRVNSIFLFPIVYATALAVVLPLFIYAYETASSAWRKLAWMLIAGMLFVNLVDTTGRIALVGFLAGGAYYLLFVRHRRRFYQRLFVFLVLLGLSLLILFLILSQFVPFFHSLVDAVLAAIMTRSTTERLLVYEYTLQQVLLRPVFGWGTELDVTGFGLPVGSHGLYLALLYRQGVVGLITFVSTLLWLAYSGRPFSRLDTTDAGPDLAEQVFAVWSVVDRGGADRCAGDGSHIRRNHHDRDLVCFFFGDRRQADRSSHEGTGGRRNLTRTRLLRMPRPTLGSGNAAVDAVKRYSFLGVEMDALTIDEVDRLIASAVVADEHWIIANHNLHSVYLYHHDERIRRFLASARYVHIDGMPLVLIGRALGFPLKRIHRITYVDWIRPLLTEAQQNGWRVFYLGSQPSVVERAGPILRAEFPRLEVELRHGYFDTQPGSLENREVLEQVRRYRPHILMVGMGMPRQEHWILDNMPELPANIILNAGACLDYLAGAVPTPPRWMGRMGLEWLYRLVSEPRRLWRRYLVEPWYIARLLLRDIWCLRIRPSRIPR